ncbi:MULTISPECIES: flagellar basal body rod protein [unclassified Prochlorococcus]|uniref:flagellar basal body rod protein n=1 Tax=unclassified Prochlorococcus TaxID=2627481 RepID=UPI000533BADB|nr:MULTISPECIES: flagellar basal body rod protein [unclassified Prochlorococcus]KGG30659.1 putative Flagella basal body rod protein [Prochlorococcus sp. MIT 0702]
MTEPPLPSLLRWLPVSFLAAFSVLPIALANEPGLSPKEVVRRYSNTVACQIYGSTPGYQQYATVELEPVHSQYPSGVWLVGWTGDLGCMGGNGTQGLQINLVSQNGFSNRTVSPVVIDSRPMPDLVMNGLRDLSFKDGVVTIRGTTGRANFGTFQEVTARYRWNGMWTGGGQPRFERLP